MSALHEPDSHSNQSGYHMPDGTVYAGSLDGKDIYAMPVDAVTRRWLRAPRLTFSFNEAAEFAKNLNRENYLGHDDWRVPTKGVLNLLFTNRAAIGGFNESGSFPAGWYLSSTPGWCWPSTPRKDVYTWAQRFSDGHQIDGYGKVFNSSLRCVRG